MQCRTSAVCSLRSRRGSFVPAGLLALALWGVASLRGDELQAVQVAPESPLLRLLLSDPVMHALTFGLLTLLLGWGLRGRAEGRAPLALAGGLAAGYGLLIELYQALLPRRTFGLDDLAGNTLGVLVALALLRGGRGCASGFLFGRRRTQIFSDDD